MIRMKLYILTFQFIELTKSKNPDYPKSIMDKSVNTNTLLDSANVVQRSIKCAELTCFFLTIGLEFKQLRKI